MGVLLNNAGRKNIPSPLKAFCQLGGYGKLSATSYLFLSDENSWNSKRISAASFTNCGQTLFTRFSSLIFFRPDSVLMYTPRSLPHRVGDRDVDSYDAFCLTRKGTRLCTLRTDVPLSPTSQKYLLPGRVPRRI